MVHALRGTRAVPAFLLACAALALGACDRDNDIAPATSKNSSPSAVVAATAPAPAAGVAVPTSPATDNSELSKAQESNAMPLPGQPNDHSNLAPNGSQRAGALDPQQSPQTRSP